MRKILSVMTVLSEALVCNSDLVMTFHSKENILWSCVSHRLLCVGVYSYLPCLIGSVSVIFKCLCDCDTLCLRPPLEVRGQANKVNVSSCHKDQHQHLGSSALAFTLTDLHQGHIQRDSFLATFLQSSPSNSRTCPGHCLSRPLSVSSCCAFKPVSVVLSNYLIGLWTIRRTKMWNKC